MRILIACTHPTIVGGIETYLQQLIPALRVRGHTLALLTSAAPHPRALPIHPPADDLPFWRLVEADRARVVAELAMWHPEVAFLHGMNSSADEEFLVANYPTVLFAHGHNGTCISGSRTFAFPTPRPCHRRFGLSCLLHYFPRRCGGLNPLTMTHLFLEQKRRSELFTRYAAVIVTSRSMVEEYLQHGVSPERLHRVPLFPTGLTPDPSPPSCRTPSGRVLMVGRLYKEKGACLLVQALAQVNALLGKPVTLVVAGDGPERHRMEALASHLRVPTEFHGWVDSDRRTDLMRGADLLALPSVCPETFGLVGVEAACVGLPAVAFAVGGIPDWLIPGQSGELAPASPPTPRKLAQAIHRILADPNYLRQLSAGSWEMAQNFSREQHLFLVETILRNAVGRT